MLSHEKCTECHKKKSLLSKIFTTKVEKLGKKLEKQDNKSNCIKVFCWSVKLGAIQISFCLNFCLERYSMFGKLLPGCFGWFSHTGIRHLVDPTIFLNNILNKNQFIFIIHCIILELLPKIQFLCSFCP